MKTIRRLYFYAVALISIEVVLWGIIGLLRSILDSSEVVNGASTLAQALSLILVGVPIFLFHWVWAQRSSAQEDEERSASIRAAFLYGILLGTLVPAVQNLLALIDRTFLASANLYTYRAVVGGSQTWLDNLIAIVINLLIAAYFWNVLKENWRSIKETENFAEIRRLYRFIWMLYGLLMTIYGAQQALSFIFTLSIAVLGEVARETAINAVSLMVIGAPIWIYSWRILQDGLADPDERESYLRLGILYLLSLGGVIVVLTTGGNLIYMLLMRLFDNGQTMDEFIQNIGSPISIGVPFGVLWAYYGKWLSHQFNFDENLPRRAGKQRLYFYLLSFLGLAATFFSAASIFSLVMDLLTTRGSIVIGNYDSQISSALAFLVVGLPLWLKTWQPMQMQALDEKDAAMGDHARRSIIRKSYLYLVLFAAVIGGMISAGILAFTLINGALGGSTSNYMKTVLNAFQMLVLFVVLLLYHLSALRKDGAARASTLDEKQGQFHVVVFDRDGMFGESVKAAFSKRAPNVPVTVADARGSLPPDLKADAVVLPGSLAVNTPESLEAWLRSFNGNRLIVSDEAAGVFWMNDPDQVADSAKAMAEGQDLRPQSSKRMTSVWTYVAYVFAALFACQLLIMLTTFGISLVSGF
ncbi:MAG TPA: DUF5671 domain-containing protein [Anaerolineales bacterium]|nr:DUF5671 domain-containing protein [Anaerolineales bacterium]HNN12446.1 DUF5671 domain-containing protein [Anaerolineales bacterium]HNO30490.1 DUF5671 domain-containing protein [Anaerolineales bacterium]